MKYLGIDYGLKNVGLAVSDDGEKLAFSKIILQNDKDLVVNILNIIKNDNIGGVVIGESVNFLGKPNKIMKNIDSFKNDLQKEIDLPIYFQKEILTSVEAERIQGGGLKKVRKNLRKEKKVCFDKNDASAAALILRSFLELRNFKKIIN